MKIGFVLDDTLDSSDGVQQYVVSLGEWLASKGHEVHYLVGQTGRSDISNVHSLSKNINVRFNKNRMTIPLPVRNREIKNLLDKLALDIMHIQMPYSPQLGARVINNASGSTAVVATFHILPYSKKEMLATTMLSKLVQKSSKRIDKVISVSSPAAEFVKNTYNSESIVIPNPVNIKKFSKAKQLKHDGVNIVYLGRLVERKGVMQLLESIKLMKQQSHDTKFNLTIGGKGHLESRIEQYIYSNNLGSDIRILGYIPEKTKPEILANADIAIFPSLGGESFGIVLTEAMAAGAGVVVGGDNPGYRSVLIDQRVLVDPKDISGMTDKLLSVMNDLKLRDELHNYQQTIVKKYDIEAVGPRIMTVYDQEIAKRN